MDRDTAMQWVAGYERAWREGDIAAVDALFTEDAEYWYDPYQEPEVGHAAIRAFWSEPDGTTFTVESEPVAVDSQVAVVRLQVQYLTPAAQDYRNLWVLRFAGDGRVDKFEEWAFFPGKPVSATHVEQTV